MVMDMTQDQPINPVDKRHFPDTQGIIWVIDSNDRERIHKSKDQIPPTYAAGIEPRAKFMKRFLLKYLIL